MNVLLGNLTALMGALTALLESIDKVVWMSPPLFYNIIDCVRSSLKCYLIAISM